MNSDLVSVIVPYCNCENYIKDTLESIVSQTYKSLEIFAINNNSEDGSVKIVEALAKKDSRIIMLSCDDAGLSATRNTGLRQCRGRWVVFADGDDNLPSDAIESLVSAASDDTDMVQGAYIQYKESLKKPVRECIPPIFEGEGTKAIHKYYLEGGRGFNFAWGKLYKRSLFEGTDYPDEKYYEDIAILPRIINNCTRLTVIDKPVYSYILHKNSLSNSALTVKHVDGLTARLENFSFYRKEYPELANGASTAALEFSFYLMGKIVRVGRKDNLTSWDYTLSRARELKNTASPDSFLLKAATALLGICPVLLGYLFALYSFIKNRV